MAGAFILTLDQGTSSSRALIVDQEGAVVATAAREFPQIYPQPGWVEHDPEAIWASQLRAARDVVAQAGLPTDEIAAIGIANQRETAIVWDRQTGRPIANAIVWQCRRTAADCDRLRRDGLAALIQQRTGLVIDAYFSATKIAWLLDHVPGGRQAAEAGRLAFGTVDSWLIYRLTSGRVHATDETNASRTMLYNLDGGHWDEELCRLLRVPRSMLPEIQRSGSVFGETDPAWFGRSLPVTSVAGDQQAALFGQACYVDGATKNTYGTGCFALRHTGTRRTSPQGGLIATAAASQGPQRSFAIEGSIFVAGAAVQWLRDGLGIIKAARDVEPLALSVADSGGVYFVPAFVGLGAPHWDASARGTITGLTRGSTAGHLARATLEAIAFQTREVIDLFDREAGASTTALRVDGGAAQNDLLLQIQANLLGRAVVRPASVETTALGVAFLAGITAGLWKDESETGALWREERCFEPRITTEERDLRYSAWLEAVSRARRVAAEPVRE